MDLAMLFVILVILRSFAWKLVKVKFDEVLSRSGTSVWAV
jgi:hypothetical protein